MNDKEYLKAMVDSPQYNLDAMYAKIRAEYDALLLSVYDREDLIEIMYEHAKNGDAFMEMAHDISDNPFTEYFCFDPSCWGNGCDPIDTKEDLMNACLYGTV